MFFHETRLVLKKFIKYGGESEVNWKKSKIIKVHTRVASKNIRDDLAKGLWVKALVNLHGMHNCVKIRLQNTTFSIRAVIVRSSSS